MVNFVGIDQSLTGTGICVLDKKDNVLLLTTLKQKTPKSLEDEIKRLRNILSKIINVYNKHKPCLVGMEDYGYMTKGRSFKLGELGGIIKLALYERGVTPEVFKATHIKKFLTGKGNAEKNLMLMNVYKKYKISCETDDEADALIIAKLLKAKHDVKEKFKKEKDFNKKEWEVIKKILTE